MAKVHVHNATDKVVEVECFKHNTTHQWGKTHSIEPGTHEMVYGTGLKEGTSMFEARADLEIRQVALVNTRDGETKDVTIKSTRFRSGKDQSWIVKESRVVEQDHGEKLDREAPDGEKHPWEVKADKIVLKDLSYDTSLFDGLPDDTWTPVGTAETCASNGGASEVTVNASVEVAVAESRSWSRMVGLTLSVQAEVSAGIPEVCEGKLTVGAETTNEYTWSEEQTTSMNWGVHVSVPVPANHRARVTGTVYQARLPLPYTATLLLHYDGAMDPVETRVCGEYDGVVARRICLFIHEAEPLLGQPRTEKAVARLAPADSSVSHDAGFLHPGERRWIEYNTKARIFSVVKSEATSTV